MQIEYAHPTHLHHQCCIKDLHEDSYQEDWQTYRTMAMLAKVFKKPGYQESQDALNELYHFWDAIQEAKKREAILTVVWLDIANAYGSVPHALLMEAMEFFHVPEEVREIMRGYYDCFQILFSMEEFQEEGHYLEIEISAGCTMSVIWVIPVTEMLLRATNCPDEIAKVRAPKKAFTDDVKRC